MRRRFTRIIVFAILIIGLGVGYNFISNLFSGDGKDSPEEALPQDASYVWIEGPKSKKEQRFFFLSNGNYFGTQIVTENFKGWSTGQSTASPLVKAIEENTINAAFSDSKILFGLIKPNGKVKVTVNEQVTKRIPFNTLSKEAIKNYNVQGYEIWYIDLSELAQPKKYRIQVLDENNSLINELLI
ncbi:hypothetical protein [Lysinibacillus sp. SGAir0095]|uniref:hypothetical protein n=1 Tax=Lysinibacillus sp. SGAir0095 TaxID=2070463 RepID=UPI0010F84A19|nr:hypothetical protein [Lysinibacillus sp. SGAir0095]